MATFTITAANTNIDSLAGKAGGDVYNVNGGELIIDQDTRFGLNNGAGLTMGNITISATLGGKVLVDSRAVRIIPYNTGSGNVPALGTTISQGGVSGKLIAVMSTLTTTPTAAGAAMPASGFIKVKQVGGGEFASGALTGIGASATGPSVQGFIEVVGDEASTCTVPRLGTFQVMGGKYALGTTSGSANQQIQLPTQGLAAIYIPGVYIETGVGSNVYDFYANAASQTSVAADLRANTVWISTGGLLRIGHNGTANAGRVPESGLRIFLPSNIFENCTTAARTANALPNATLATRYDFTTSGGGVLDVHYAIMNWYPIFAQPFLVTMEYTGVAEQISISECAQSVTLDHVGVGQTAAQANVALVLALCTAGISISACHFTRATLASSGAYTATITDCLNVQITGTTRFTGLTVKGNATSGNILFTRTNTVYTDNLVLVNGRAVYATCDGINMVATHYVDVITGTTATTAAQNSYVVEISAATKNLIIDGVDFFGLTNVHPYLGILNVAAAFCSRIFLRNVGAGASPLSLGSANQSAYLFVLATGAAAIMVRVKRCYVISTRTGLYSVDNSSKDVIVENCGGDYADVPVAAALNMLVRGMKATPTLAAQTAVYGTHFQDYFISATVGRIGFMMNEATNETSAYVTTDNGAAFTSAGGLYMPTVGMSATFELPYYALGHESFTNSALVMAGGTVGNYRFDVDVDLNDANGFVSIGANMTAAQVGTALNALSVLPDAGVKLRIKVTTTTANSTAITSFYVITGTSSTSQNDIQYPLEEPASLDLTGLVIGSDIVILNAGAETAINEIDENGADTYTYTHQQAGLNVDICIYMVGYKPYMIRNYTLPSTNTAIPIAQVQDPFYID